MIHVSRFIVSTIFTRGLMKQPSIHLLFQLIDQPKWIQPNSYRCLYLGPASILLLEEFCTDHNLPGDHNETIASDLRPGRFSSDSCTVPGCSCNYPEVSVEFSLAVNMRIGWMSKYMGPNVRFTDIAKRSSAIAIDEYQNSAVFNVIGKTLRRNSYRYSSSHRSLHR